MGIYVFRLPSLKVFILKSLVWEYFRLISCSDSHLGFFFLRGNGGGGVYGYAEYTKQQQFLKEKWGIGGT